MTEGILMGRADGTRWHRPRSVLLCLACIAAGCGESHLQGDSSLQAEGASLGQDAASPLQDAAIPVRDAAMVVPDAAPDMDAGDELGDAGSDEGPDPVDAAVDPGLELPECGGAEGELIHWPWSRWPVPELTYGLPRDLAQTDCRVRLDRGDDGSVDLTWGYVYEAGKLREVLTARSSFTFSEARTLYDEAERPWASCDPSAGGCLLYLYDDASDRARVAVYDYPREVLPHPPDVPQFLIRAEHAAEGGRIRWDRCPTFLVCDGHNWCPREHARYQNGILRDYQTDNAEQWSHQVYHPDGRLSEHRDLNDLLVQTGSCSVDGWALAKMRQDDSHVDDDIQWETSYTRGTDGRVQSSRTITTLPVEGAFTTTYTWAADGNSVRLDSVDDGGLWQESHVETMVSWRGVQERDALGNLTAVRYDDDRDGIYDRADSYTYEGEGPCREGKAVHLEQDAADGPQVTYRCEHSPVNNAILAALALNGSQ